MLPKLGEGPCFRGPMIRIKQYSMFGSALGLVFWNKRLGYGGSGFIVIRT